MKNTSWRARQRLVLATRFENRLGTIAALMSVQATSALNDEVDWSEIAHHRVEVEIERLLDNLRRNDDTSMPSRSALLWRARLAKTVDNVLLDGCPGR